MKQNHFIYSYRGNKRQECSDIYKVIEPHLDGINIIIEPFCGSSAFSYYMSLKYPKKFKYILNDFDENLIKVYKLLRNDNATKQLIKNLKVLNKDITKDKYLSIYKRMNEDINCYVYCNLVYVIRPGIFPYDVERVKNKNMDALLEKGIINFLRTETINIIHGDGISIIDKYKNFKNVLLFVDPPYLMTCNGYYDMSCVDSEKQNVYQYLSYNCIDNFKAYACLVLEKNWIINLLFGKNIRAKNSKMYQQSKKKTEHWIIDNRQTESI